MTPAVIKERVRELVAKHLDVPIEKVTDLSDLIGDLGGDSLTSVEIVMDVEEEFDIEINDDEAHSLLTIIDVANLVARKLENAP